MAEYLGLPSIHTQELGPEYVKEHGDCMVYPRFLRLAMGLAHSVRIMQLIHEEALRRHAALPPGGLLRARGPAPVLGKGGADQPVAGGLYIDDKYTIGVR